MKVWTNGCFDILHRGHIELFRFAKSLGDELMVGVDTDAKVKEEKGKDRPINNINDRIYMLQAIKYIDKVIPFDSGIELEEQIKWYSPDIMVIGGDWRHKQVLGKQHAKRLVFFDRVGDYSTTSIIHGDK